MYNSPNTRIMSTIYYLFIINIKYKYYTLPFTNFYKNMCNYLLKRAYLILH